jgi:ribosomal protein L21E
MKKAKGMAKVGKVMHEYKAGELHSGKGGPVVKSRKQAIAIAMSQAGMAKKPMKKSAGRGR